MRVRAARGSCGAPYGSWISSSPAFRVAQTGLQGPEAAKGPRPQERGCSARPGRPPGSQLCPAARDRCRRLDSSSWEPGEALSGPRPNAPVWAEPGDRGTPDAPGSPPGCWRLKSLPPPLHPTTRAPWAPFHPPPNFYLLVICVSCFNRGGRGRELWVTLTPRPARSRHPALMWSDSGRKTRKET